MRHFGYTGAVAALDGILHTDEVVYTANFGFGHVETKAILDDDTLH